MKYDYNFKASGFYAAEHSFDEGEAQHKVYFLGLIDGVQKIKGLILSNYEFAELLKMVRPSLDRNSFLEIYGELCYLHHDFIADISVNYEFEGESKFKEAELDYE